MHGHFRVVHGRFYPMREVILLAREVFQPMHEVFSVMRKVFQVMRRVFPVIDKVIPVMHEVFQVIDGLHGSRDKASQAALARYNPAPFGNGRPGWKNPPHHAARTDCG